ncbi:MAG: RICIN domain-containing protein [bacterium]|nr:RICIN domain-containing protein [bacterium]
MNNSSRKTSRTRVWRSTLVCALAAGALLTLTGPARAHDPALPKDPDTVQLPDPELLKAANGDLVVGIADKCLDVEGADPSDGTFLQIFECHGQDNQRFELVPVGTFFELRGLAGKCVQPGGGEDERRLMLGPCDGLEDRWDPDPDLAGDFTLVHVTTGKCMDVRGASTEDRTPVKIYDCHFGVNQTWRLEANNPAGLIEEAEPNNSIASSQFLPPEAFTRTYDVDIGNFSDNNSVAMPHVSILGTGDDTFDYYSFIVPNAWDQAIFDIDATVGMDSYLRLYNGSGVLLSTNDDSSVTWGAAGSVTGLDSFMRYTFSQPGTYVIQVARCCGTQPVPDGASYKLNVSIGLESAMVLNGNRFAVAVDWRTDDGSGFGRPSELRTDDSGIFYFFNADNLELLIKVLDGCAINERYWVFFAATTDVEFTVTVTDLVHGVSKTYSNPAHHPADAVTDSSAFATCP